MNEVKINATLRYSIFASLFRHYCGQNLKFWARDSRVFEAVKENWLLLDCELRDYITNVAQQEFQRLGIPRGAGGSPLEAFLDWIEQNRDKPEQNAIHLEPFNHYARR